jgi:hypothetical protein
VPHTTFFRVGISQMSYAAIALTTHTPTRPTFACPVNLG